MKTRNFLSAVTLAVIILGTSMIYAGTPGTGSSANLGGWLIRYQVNIHWTREASLCNTYMVQLVNKNGESVAPAQVYVPGQSAYTFYETGPVTGVREARLIVRPGMKHYVCEQELWTRPDFMAGTFLNGTTYKFDLYPQTVPPAKD
jgi:hypothetical protein